MNFRIALLAGGLLLGTCVVGHWSQAQDPSGNTPAAVTRRGPLPANFVTNEQRESLYVLQEAYEARIRPLQAEIERLEQELDRKLIQQLTPGQQKRLKELRAPPKSSFP